MHRKLVNNPPENPPAGHESIFSYATSILSLFILFYTLSLRCYMENIHRSLYYRFQIIIDILLKIYIISLSSPSPRLRSPSSTQISPFLTANAKDGLDSKPPHHLATPSTSLAVPSHDPRCSSFYESNHPLSITCDSQTMGHFRHPEEEEPFLFFLCFYKASRPSGLIGRDMTGCPN